MATMNLERKSGLLEAELRSYGRVAVAFSGGVDSTLLLKVAVETLGAGCVMAIMADSPSMPRREIAAAELLAESMGVELVLVKTDELSDSNYVANSVERCYFCKRVIFKAIKEVATQRGFMVCCDGTNSDDSGDWRPGARAVRESGACSPLAAAGFTKEEVRALSQSLRLPTATKPAMACLASRIPYGSAVTAEVLAQIEAAEEALVQMGFSVVRVRHHGEVARIELGADEMERMLASETRSAVTAALRDVGYTYVALDLAGYRSGSLNAKLKGRP
jgi:uncharacterized protein